MKRIICTICQLLKSWILQNHQISQKHHLLSQCDVERLHELHRILQGLPGYKRHPSTLLIESIGELSLLSQENQGRVACRMKKDFLVRNAKEKTLQAKPCRFYLNRGRKVLRTMKQKNYIKLLIGPFIK